MAGPTAVGKSRLAMELAPEFGAAIVSADSRQVYRYLNIGTAKPSREEQARVPLYMLDLVEPSQTYSAQLYRDEGRRVLQRLHAAGQVAFVVGGTGFYLRALLDGLALPDVPPNPELRQRLRRDAEAHGGPALHERLREVDAVSAARIHPHNVPRVIRALEIVEHLGQPVPELAPHASVPALHLGLTMERSRLIEIADRRVLAQVEAGLVEETRLLLEMGYPPTAPALDSFGYREMIAYLRQRMTREEAIHAYQVATHRYIRRQLTWFRADPRLIWLDAERAAGAARPLIADWLALQRTANR